MAGIKGRTGNPGVSNPKKKNATSFTVESGKEPRSDKPMAFRPKVSLEAEINAAITASGLKKTEWLEAAVIAYLKQNSPEPSWEEEAKTKIAG